MLLLPDRREKMLVIPYYKLISAYMLFLHGYICWVAYIPYFISLNIHISIKIILEYEDIFTQTLSIILPVSLPFEILLFFVSLHNTKGTC